MQTISTKYRHVTLKWVWIIALDTLFFSEDLRIDARPSPTPTYVGVGAIKISKKATHLQHIKVRSIYVQLTLLRYNIHPYQTNKVAGNRETTGPSL